MDHLLSKETAPSGAKVKRQATGEIIARANTTVFSSVDFKVELIFENWQLEVERELQLIYEIGGERSPP